MKIIIEQPLDEFFERRLPQTLVYHIKGEADFVLLQEERLARLEPRGYRPISAFLSFNDCCNGNPENPDNLHWSDTNLRFINEQATLTIGPRYNATEAAKLEKWFSDCFPRH